MRKKLLSTCLILLLFLTTMSPLFFPSIVLAVDPGPSATARVVQTVGDGLRYYVVFEYNGKQYRSDQMGSTFNSNIWSLLSDTDKRAVAYNYAFAPGYLADQFGSAGSNVILDWSNEVTGWKAAGEAWENAIGAREYSELAGFFTGTGYNDMRVGDKSLIDVRNELGGFSAEVKESSQYRLAYQLIQEIDQEYAAGQAIYEKLKDIKAKQVGNAFKVGSKTLIKDVIVDNIMVPAITPSAGKVSELIAGCISFVKDRVGDMYDKLQREPKVDDILKAMQEVLDKLEETDKGIKGDINSKLGQLSSQMETLRRLQEEKDKERQRLMEQKEEALEATAETAFSWSQGAVYYGIPAPNDKMTEEEFAEKRAQVQAEAASIKAEFEDLLAGVLERKHDTYAILGYDDGQVLTNHPNFDQKYMEKLWVSSYAPGPFGALDMSTHFDPGAYFSYYSPYSQTKSAIISGGNEVVDKWGKSITLLENYIKETEDFIADEELWEAFDGIEQKINGLSNVYSIYVGGDLKGYVFGSNTYDVIKSNLELMLTNQLLPGYYGAFGSDYEMLAMLQDQKALVQKNLDDFQEDVPVFESEIATAAAGYDSLYTNLQNSATFMYGAYTSRKNLYKDSPYFTFYQPETQGENIPIVDEDYVNVLIAAAPAGQREAVINGIIADLRELRVQELQFLHRINTGKLNCEYDANKLDQLLRELGIYNNEAAYDNLGVLIGHEITDSWRYLAENDDLLRLYLGLHILNSSNIPRFIERLEGKSDAYYKLLILADEIELRAGYLRSLSDEDFETKFEEYKNELDNSLTAGLNQLQVERAWAEYNRGYQTLVGLREERFPDDTVIPVDAIYLVFAGTQTAANSIGLNAGETCQLEAIIHPSDSSNWQVFWSSDNQDVVTINNQGLVTAVADGTAYITVRSADGNAEASCYVMVGTGGGGGHNPPTITVNCELPEEGAQISLSNPMLQVSGSIEAEGKAITGIEVWITSHAAMEEGNYEGVMVEGIGPEVIGIDNRFSFTVDLRTLGDEYLVPGEDFLEGYQLSIWVRAEDESYGECSVNYLVVEGGAAELAAAKAAAAAKVQANYTAASWAVLTTALAMPETTPAEIAAKTTAINNAIAGLVLISSGGGGGNSGGSSSPTPPTATTPNTSPPATTTGGTTTATTSTTATLNTATGTATAPVSASAMTALTSQAQAAEAAGQKAVVEIKVEAAPEAKAVELTIPKTSFAVVANDTEADVQVSTPLAIVTFDSKAVQSINNAAPSGDVSISVANVDAAALSPEARTLVGDRPVYDFSVKAGNTEVSNFEGGKIRISIPYTPQPGEKEDAIVVYYIDNNNNLIAVRGAFNPATNTVDFEATHFSKYAVGYNEVRFKDVEAGDGYSRAVGFLAARGIVSGIGAGSFAPNQKLTRGQYVVMVMKAYGIDPERHPIANFADAGNSYYTGYLAAAKRLNIVSGIGNNMYAPERLITRQEMFTLLYNALQAIGELPKGKSGQGLDSFGDAGQIASWAKPALKLFVETGMVSGSNGLLMPLSGSSRAEMAQVLYNLLHG